MIAEAAGKSLIKDGEFSDTDEWLTRTAGTTAAIFGTSALGGDFNVASDTAQNAIDNNLLDTVWDAVSLGMSADELRKAIQSEDTSQIILSATALGIDIIAVSLPIIPGGAGAILKAKNAAKAADKVTGASKLSAQTRNKIDEVIDHAEKNKGNSLHKKGKTPKTFKNKELVLPTKDKNGNPITYKEYDIEPPKLIEGKLTRGAKRVVIGSDGSKYYSNDHYETFIEIK